MGLRAHAGERSIRQRRSSLFAIVFLALFLSAPFLAALSSAPVTGVDTWRLLAWGACTLCFVAVISFSGIRRGYLSAFLIDRRNRYSLSRLQITAWTVLAIPATAVALASNALRAADTAAFPELTLDWTIVALMGISFGSFIVAPVALSVQAQRTPYPTESEKARSRIAEQQQLTRADVSAQGSLIVKADPADARVSDLMTGEKIGNAGMLDIARVQMLAITAITCLTYGVMLFRIFAAGGQDGWIVQRFPAFDATLLALILLSHAGYITGKITPSGTQQTDAAARNTARILTLLAGVDSLASQIEASLLTDRLTSAEERQLKRLREQIDQIRSNAEKARDQIGVGRDLHEIVPMLEGQLSAVRAGYRSIVAGRDHPDDTKAAGPDLIRKVKQGLSEVLGTPLSAAEAWTGADDEALDAFLRLRGLTRDNLGPGQHRAFEDVLDLLR